MSANEHRRSYAFNALWFKPDGGEQRYQEYLRACEPLWARVAPHTDTDRGAA